METEPTQIYFEDNIMLIAGRETKLQKNLNLKKKIMEEEGVGINTRKIKILINKN